MFGIILPLTNEAIHHFCRLFFWLPIGSICDPICSRRSNVGIWILVQPVGDGSTGFLQLVRLAYWETDNFMIFWHCTFLGIFIWLVHVETLCDPWSVIICNTILRLILINVVCITWCRGRGHPISKKKCTSIGACPYIFKVVICFHTCVDERSFPFAVITCHDVTMLLFSPCWKYGA
jgi:hypothetical protein